MTQVKQVTKSFVQDDRHENKTERFVVVQPSAIAEVLKDHGFDIVGLKSGKGRKPDRMDFQTTIARYRSNDGFMTDSGLALDLMWRVPHLTGKLEARLGFFRGVCANQWNMGKLFGVEKFSHTGDVLNELDIAIPRLVAQREELIEMIRSMQARSVTPQEIVDLAKITAEARLLTSPNVVESHPEDLFIARRVEDIQPDLFTAVNVLQENVQRYGIRYTTKNVNDKNEVLFRNNVTRRINENSDSAINLNATIWDAATQLLKAG